MFDEKELKWFALKQGKLDYRFFLRKPNLEIIQELDFLENVNLNFKLGGIHELSFELPYQIINEDNKSVENPILDKFKSRYLVEARSGRGKELFIILTTDKEVDTNKNRVKFTLMSYARQLAKDIIYEYEVYSKPLSAHALELMKSSSWKLGTVEPQFEKDKYFEVKNQTLLEALIQLAEAYNALPVWNSFEKKVDFISPSRVGKNRGLVIEEEKYLERMNLKIEAEEIISQLYAYGKDNISLHSVTPTGQPYIESYNWYMHPFKMDENGNVLQSSDYMSDDLCKAIINYRQVIKDNESLFEDILERENELYDEIFQADLERSEARAELKKATDKLDILNSTKTTHTDPEQAQIEIDKAIEVKEEKERIWEEAVEKIEALQQRSDELIKEKKALNKAVSKESNFTPEQIDELDNFTVAKIYNDSTIEEPEDLLEVAKEVFEKYSKPKITADVDIINFLDIMEYYGDWDKIQLGDRIRLKHDGVGIDVIVQIMSINIDLSGHRITLEIANEHESEDEFAKKIYDSISSSTIVDMDRYKWNLAEDANDNISKLLNSVWDSTKNAIEGGVEQSVSISERGIVIRASEDPDRMLVAQNGVLALSRDGGNNWYTAITPDGVFAERLVGRILMGNKLVIEDESGIIEIIGSTQNIYDDEGNLKVQLGELDDDKGYGISIDGGSLHIFGELNEDNFSPELIEDLMYDDTQLRKDLRLETPLPTNLLLDKSGITAYTEEDSQVFARMDYRGLYVQGGAIDIRTRYASDEGVQLDGKGISGYGSDGTRTFHLDNAGNFTAQTGKFAGHLEAASGTFSGTLQAADGVFTGTLKGTDGIFSGNLSGSVIQGGVIKGAKIEGGTLNINDRFLVDSNGNMIARDGKFSGVIETEQDAIIGKRLKLNAQADDGGIVLNHREVQNGRIYYDNARTPEGDSLARLVVAGRIVKIEGTEGGIELVNSNGKTVITSTSSRRPNFEFWSRNQSVYHGKIYVDNEDNFRMLNATGTQMILGRSDNIGVEFRSSGGGYANVTAREFLPMSDRNIKENIRNYSGNAIDLINKTRVCKYNFIDDPTQEEKIGIIYQEAPKEVTTKGSKSINLYSMATLSWKAIQEMYIMIENLQQEIKGLKEKK